MGINTVFMFRDGVRFFDFDELSFVVDLTNVSLYNFGLSSALISANIDGKHNFGELIEIIRKTYNVSAAESETAVVKFITMMQKQNLIEEVN